MALSWPACRTGCLLNRVPPHQLPPYTVYHWGDQVTSKEGVFLICSGPVGCYWGEPQRCCLEVLGSGDLWEGWEAQGCEAWALGEIQGRWFEPEKWLAILRQPSVLERFVRHMQERWQRARQRQLVLAHGSVRARVAWQVVDLAERFGERDERTLEIFVPVHLTHKDEAALVGATRVRVGDALREFERKRWLVWGSQGFWVRDSEALRDQSREGL